MPFRAYLVRSRDAPFLRGRSLLAELGRSIRGRRSTVATMDAEFWVAVAAALISAVALVRGELHQGRRASGDAQHRAVDKVDDALWPVHILIEHADVRAPSGADIGRVTRDFEWDCQRWEPMLPTGARHLRVSVRQALAHFFRVAGGNRGRSRRGQQANANFRQVLVGRRLHLRGTCPELSGSMAGSRTSPPPKNRPLRHLAQRRGRSVSPRPRWKTKVATSATSGWGPAQP